MAISIEEKHHSVALRQIILGISHVLPHVYCRITRGQGRSSYQIHLISTSVNEAKTCVIGLFVKSSNKRRSPWQYTFVRDHQEEIQRLYRECDEVFTIFVNYNDGIACIDFADLKRVLDHEFEESESVSISRKLRQSYRVSGRDGSIEKPLARNVFPGKIIDFIAAAFDTADETSVARRKTLFSFLLK